jgi:hypothetical protein
MKSQRGISVVTAAVLATSMVPAAAFATEETDLSTQIANDSIEEQLGGGSLKALMLE